MNIEDKSRHELRQQILELVEYHLEQIVELNTPLREICDELDMTELFMAVEEEFDLEISPMDEELLETPADFVEFILRKSDSKSIR